MDLFNTNSAKNLLPYEGTVLNCGFILNKEKSLYYFKKLYENITWKHDTFILFGKQIVTSRKVAWFGDHNYKYTYSNATKTALPWTTELLCLKSIVERETGETFNSCLLNLYHDGSEGMAWHSDGEVYLKRNGAIGSLSFGAERKFSFKHKLTKESVSMDLQHGGLLVMKDETQHFWLHRLPPTKLVTTPRINLTFRTIDARSNH